MENDEPVAGISKGIAVVVWECANRHTSCCSGSLTPTVQMKAFIRSPGIISVGTYNCYLKGKQVGTVDADGYENAQRKAKEKFGEDAEAEWNAKHGIGP